jgi:hypothetical protein
MTLKEYRQKRRSGRSPEPRGRRRRGSRRQPHFVIQHHAASTDHYDFRLEIDGVLVSWAMPKGPSTNPKDKRMARRTEDHPTAYEAFEGVIPKGVPPRPPPPCRHRNSASVMVARKNSPAACLSVYHHHPARTRVGMVMPPKVASDSTVTPNG